MASESLVAVITGASSGIGFEAARQLAAQGWKIIGVGRNPERCKRAEHALQSALPQGDASMLVGDLSSLKDTNRLADEIIALTDRIDVLANNAGGMASEKVITPEGYEASFVANHLSGFLLILRLRKRLAETAAKAGVARVINTSSDGSEMIPTLNLDDMQTFENYSNGLAYCSGKLANVLVAKAIADRFAQDGIVGHAFHPGTVDSNFFSHTDQSVRDAYRDAPKISLADGADTLVWLATQDNAASRNGGYFYQRKPREPNTVVNDAEFIERFWHESERFVSPFLP